MPKFVKIILWLAVAFLLVAVGVVIIKWSRWNIAPAATNYSGGTMEDVSFSQTTGLSASDAGGVVRSFAQDLSVKSSASSIGSPSPMIPEANVGADRMVIKIGALSVVVKDVPEAVKIISEFAIAKKGYVVSSNVYKRGLAPYGTLIIKIPAVNFDAGLNEVKSLGEVVSASVSGQDVTEQYVDLEAQLRNLQATEKQFLTILNKATQIKDILSVQKELTNVRGQIEQLQGRMKYLRQSADMSTITVNLSTDPSVLPSVDNSKVWKPWAEVKQAARALAEAGKLLVNKLIWFVVFVPVWALLGLLIWAVVKIVKKVKARGKFTIN